MTERNQEGRRAGPVQSAGTTHAIETAAIEDLAKYGISGMSIDSVARRAGVGKASIYRRWASKREMVLGIVTDVATQADLFPDTGTLHGDLTTLFRSASRHLRHPLVARIVPDLLAEAARDPQFATVLYERVGVVRRALASRMITRAVERGELPPTVDHALAGDLVAAPVYWRLTVTREPFDESDLRLLVEMTTAALRAGGRATSRDGS